MANGSEGTLRECNMVAPYAMQLYTLRSSQEVSRKFDEYLR